MSGLQTVDARLSIAVPLRLLASAPEAPGPWPVLLALHGYAMTAEEMHAFLPRLAPAGFLVISIEGPQSTLVPGKESGIDSPRGFHWGVSPRAEENRTVHRAAVEAAIGWAAANGGDPARVSLLGFSQPT